MPDGTNKSIFSDLDKEECKEKKRTTGSKRKCTCKCLPGWKKGKETDADGNKITLCNQVTLFFDKISVIFEIFGNFDDAVISDRSCLRRILAFFDENSDKNFQKRRFRYLK